jgi:hypothetical protein
VLPGLFAVVPYASSIIQCLSYRSRLAGVKAKNSLALTQHACSPQSRRFVYRFHRRHRPARYRYQVCEAGTPTCSNDARVTFRQ